MLQSIFYSICTLYLLITQTLPSLLLNPLPVRPLEIRNKVSDGFSDNIASCLPERDFNLLTQKRASTNPDSIERKRNDVIYFRTTCNGRKGVVDMILSKNAEKNREENEVQKSIETFLQYSSRSRDPEENELVITHSRQWMLTFKFGTSDFYLSYIVKMREGALYTDVRDSLNWVLKRRFPSRRKQASWKDWENWDLRRFSGKPFPWLLTMFYTFEAWSMGDYKDFETCEKHEPDIKLTVVAHRENTLLSINESIYKMTRLRKKTIGKGHVNMNEVAHRQSTVDGPRYSRLGPIAEEKREA